MLVAGGKKRLVQVDEAIGIGALCGHRRLKGQERRRLGRVVPDGWASGLHVALRQRVGRECDREIEAGAQGRNDMVMDVLGEWTAVVIEQDERGLGGDGHHAIVPVDGPGVPVNGSQRGCAGRRALRRRTSATVTVNPSRLAITSNGIGPISAHKPSITQP